MKGEIRRGQRSPDLQLPPQRTRLAEDLSHPGPVLPQRTRQGQFTAAQVAVGPQTPSETQAQTRCLHQRILNLDGAVVGIDPGGAQDTTHLQRSWELWSRQMTVQAPAGIGPGTIQLDVQPLLPSSRAEGKTQVETAVQSHGPRRLGPPGTTADFRLGQKKATLATAQTDG